MNKPLIIFEDSHQLVVNKPPGLLTQPSGTDFDSLETQCKAYLREVHAKPGNVFLEAVHRIDKPVSGIVLFAKTSKGLSRLNQSMRDKTSKKTYLALVEGALSNKEGDLEHYLVHGDHQAIVSTKANPEAKYARLSYKTIKCDKQTTLLEIILDTGRYHQIRAQLAAIKCPIVGDVRYGSRTQVNFAGIALHHSSLQIPHPVTKELQTFHAEPPAVWYRGS